MKNVTKLIVALFIGTMFISKTVSAQMPGSLVPIVLLKTATGYWDKADDADGDGVVDADDACPNVFGTVNGCPEKDTDGDGVVDSKDKCPEIKGTIEGCPEKDLDTDGDGVIDLNDKCPTVKGTVDGCPDTDGDGIVDSKDDCPTVKGTINGCPDTDGDGIVDSKDDCPTVKGTINGCPDTDGDGIIDSKDDCPEIKGTIEANGCLLSKEEKRIIKEASANIYFQTGSSKIKPESYADLDKLTEILKKHPEVKARVEGYTDSSGNAQKNLSLSKARAASVKKYLIQHGEKEDHVTSEGYGINNPVATNDTKEGRAKNRRVEIVISSYEVAK